MAEVTEQAPEKDPFDIDEAPAVTLDRKRNFASVVGEEPKRYLQDGKYFDYAGNLIREG